MFAKVIKNFFWNTWDNLTKVLGLSMIGTILNIPLIIGVVMLWGSAKLTPQQMLLNKKGPTSIVKTITPKNKKNKIATIKETNDKKVKNKIAAKKTTVKKNKKLSLDQAYGRKTKKIPKSKKRKSVYQLKDTEAYNLFGRMLLPLLLCLSFPIMASVFATARQNIDGTATRFFRDIFRNLKKYFLRSSALFLINLVVYYLFFIAFGFYLFNLKLLIGDIPIIKWAAIGITGWLFFFYTMMQLYLLPLLIHKKESFTLMFKKAALLVVDNIVHTVAVFVISVVLMALSTFSMVIISVLLPGVLAMLHMTNFHIMLLQYEPPEETAEKTEFVRDFSAENETRSWKTIFKPWDN